MLSILINKGMQGFFLFGGTRSGTRNFIVLAILAQKTRRSSLGLVRRTG